MCAAVPRVGVVVRRASNRHNFHAGAWWSCALPPPRKSSSISRCLPYFSLFGCHFPSAVGHEGEGDDAWG